MANVHVVMKTHAGSVSALSLMRALKCERTKILATSAYRPGRSGRSSRKDLGGQGHGQAFGENFKQPKNREDSSYLDDFLDRIDRVASIYHFEIMACLGGKNFANDRIFRRQ